LRERIGRELGRVKEWIAERFPDPLQQIKERSRDLFDTVVEKAQRAMGWDAGKERDVDTPTLKGGIFDGVQFSAGPAEGFSAPTVAAPATPAETAPMSLAEQLEMRSNEVAERLEREARASRGHEGDEGGGEIGQRRSPTPDGLNLNELTLEELLQVRVDDVARRVDQEIVQDSAARAQRAEVERQRVHDEETQEKQRGGRSRGRFLGDEDDFTPGRGR
jgi:hypothetical protein